MEKVSSIQGAVIPNSITWYIQNICIGCDLNRAIFPNAVFEGTQRHGSWLLILASARHI